MIYYHYFMFYVLDNFLFQTTRVVNSRQGRGSECRTNYDDVSTVNTGIIGGWDANVGASITLKL